MFTLFEVINGVCIISDDIDMLHSRQLILWNFSTFYKKKYYATQSRNLYM